MKHRSRSRSRSAQSSSKPSGFIRIIAGKHRGRKLPVHDVEGLRPTTDRVKETVFNWLMMHIRDAKVLDSFAGAGSLGFEALSRFAAHVDFIELDKNAKAQLDANVAALNADNAEVLLGDALKVIATLDAKYDVVFIDPPFNKGLAQTAIEQLTVHQRLAEGAVIYIETEQGASYQIPSEWTLLKEKRYGQVLSCLYQTA